MRNSQVTKFLILFVFVFLCSCDLFKSMCEAEKPPKQSTTLQQIVNDTNAGETIDLEKYSNEYDITDYNAEISKNLTIKNGSFQNTTLKIKAEVKLEKVQELSVETSANLTIRDSKLNNLLLGTNAESRSTNSGNTNFDLKVIVKNCEIAEKIKINSKAKLNIAGEKTKIAKIVVAVAAEVCKILCTTEVDTKKIENVITDENGKKPEEIKITQAYKITYHSNCDELENIEDFFSPDDGTISLPTDIFKRNDYIFAGWCRNNNDEETITTWDVSGETNDINVYAKWESKFYSYTSKIGNLIFEWGGGFSVLLLTDEQLEVCNNAKDFKQATAEKPEYQIAAFGDMIVDTTKEGNFAVYGRNGSKYDGVAVTIKDNTFTLFIDMTKLTKTQLKGLWKDTGNGDEAFITEDDTVNLTGYKPYVIALTTQDKDVNNFKFRAWGADLMAMTGNATFPTDLQQSAPTTGNTNEVKELTATADTVADTIRNLSAGTYTLKVSGGITNTTITEIANAMNSNTEAKINLDLSGANGVTTIGDYAFFGCSGLTSITIPESVIKIEANAFISCTALNSVTIGNGVTSIGASAFCNCSGLTSIEIPDSVTTIDQQAFEACSNLASVTIGNSVTTIGNYAFYNCSNLASVTIGNNVTTIGDYAFYNCSSLTNITINNDVTTIGSNAFEGCLSLTSVTIPSKVDNIGYRAFAKCSNLTKFEIDSGNQNYLSLDGGKILCRKVEDGNIFLIDYPSANGAVTIPENENITTIEHSAFYACSALTSVKIPKGVTNINDCAFEECGNLESVTIPASTTDIANFRAFAKCSNLTKFEIDSGNQNYLSLDDGKILCRKIEDGTIFLIDYPSANGDVTIPENEYITTIDHSAFWGCSMTNVTIPNSVTKIDCDAFLACAKLASITIPSSVIYIGTQAFSECSKLTSITFNDTGSTWYCTDSEEYTGGEIIDVTDTAQNANTLKVPYYDKYWYKESSTGGTAN